MASVPAASGTSEQIGIPFPPARPGQLDLRLLAVRQLGDRPVGPHPARNRSRPRQSAGHHGGAARRRPDLGRLGHHRLCHLARSRQPAAVAEETLAGRQHSVALFRKRLEGGYISDFEMSQVQAEYESAVAAIPDLKQAIAVQEDALSVLLGRNPGPITRGQEPARPRHARIPASLPAELLTRRPDILKAEQRLIASNALIGAARALYFPRISLTGLGGLASKSLGNLFTGSARTWTFTGDVAGPIYTGGGLKSATDQAVARREQALAAYELTIQNAFREVEDALVTVQTSRELEQSLERRVASLKPGADAGARALRQWLFRLSRRARHRAEPVFRRAVARRRAGRHLSRAGRPLSRAGRGLDRPGRRTWPLRRDEPKLPAETVASDAAPRSAPARARTRNRRRSRAEEISNRRLPAAAAPPPTRCARSS